MKKPHKALSQNFEGTQLEIKLAKQLGIPVYQYEDIINQNTQTTENKESTNQCIDHTAKCAFCPNTHNLTPTLIFCGSCDQSLSLCHTCLTGHPKKLP